MYNKVLVLFLVLLSQPLFTEGQEAAATATPTGYCIICISDRCIIIICVREKSRMAKRQQISNVAADETAIEEFFPTKFSDYDTNNDGQISFGEFEAAIRHVHDQNQLHEVFNAADENGDGQISCDEFLAAPLNFGNASPVCE